MDFTSLFGSASDAYSDYGGGYFSSIASIAGEYGTYEDIFTGKADSETYGRGVGTAVGAYFGMPALGGAVGEFAFPLISEMFHGIGDAIK